jgi:hypothetical protein
VSITGTNLDRIATISLMDSSTPPHFINGAIAPATGSGAVTSNTTAINVTFTGTGVGTLKNPAGVAPKPGAYLQFTTKDDASGAKPQNMTTDKKPTLPLP